MCGAAETPDILYSAPSRPFAETMDHLRLGPSKFFKDKRCAELRACINDYWRHASAALAHCSVFSRVKAESSEMMPADSV